MNKEEKFVITISRQFGTGGHEIGAELAVPCRIPAGFGTDADNVMSGIGATR